MSEASIIQGDIQVDKQTLDYRQTEKKTKKQPKTNKNIQYCMNL